MRDEIEGDRIIRTRAGSGAAGSSRNSRAAGSGSSGGSRRRAGLNRLSNLVRGRELDDLADAQNTELAFRGEAVENHDGIFALEIVKTMIRANLCKPVTALDGVANDISVSRGRDRKARKQGRYQANAEKKTDKTLVFHSENPPHIYLIPADANKKVQHT